MRLLERIGAIPSAEEWKKFRVVRNALAHEYPEEPELRVSAINRFLEGAVTLSSLFKYLALNRLSIMRMTREQIKI